MEYGDINNCGMSCQLRWDLACLYKWFFKRSSGRVVNHANKTLFKFEKQPERIFIQSRIGDFIFDYNECYGNMCAYLSHCWRPLPEGKMVDKDGMVITYTKPVVEDFKITEHYKIVNCRTSEGLLNEFCIRDLLYIFVQKKRFILKHIYGQDGYIPVLAISDGHYELIRYYYLRNYIRVAAHDNTTPFLLMLICCYRIIPIAGLEDGT